MNLYTTIWKWEESHVRREAVLYVWEDIRRTLRGESIHDFEDDIRNDPYDELYFRKMKAMYEDMFHTLQENVLIAKTSLENGQKDLALRRIKMGLQRAEALFLEQNIDWPAAPKGILVIPSFLCYTVCINRVEYHLEGGALWLQTR